MLNQNLGKYSLTNFPVSCGLLKASHLHPMQAQSKEDQDPTATPQGPRPRRTLTRRNKAPLSEPLYLGCVIPPPSSSDNYQIEEMSH